MPKLTDLQLVLLSTAAQREDGSLLPPPEHVGHQAARIRKAIPVLLKSALVEEIAVTDAARVWREDGDARIGLAITAAGRASIAEEVEQPAAGHIASAPLVDEPASAQPDKRVTKIDTVLGMLRRTDGATLPELVETTGWLPHTTRAALAGLRKKGHGIDKRKRGDVTCYHLGEVA
jgi:hypothetical protein